MKRSNYLNKGHFLFSSILVLSLAVSSLPSNTKHRAAWMQQARWGVMNHYRASRIADKPLFRDPVHDGAADPVLCWSRDEKKWFMFYTNRRANVPNTKGVSWVHGTKIGIAES